MPSRLKLLTTFLSAAAALVLPVVFVLLTGLDLKRAFLRMARFVVEGVKDDVGVVAAVSMALVGVVWAVIILRSIFEARADAALQSRESPLSPRETTSRRPIA